MATIKKYNGSTWENAVVRKYGTASEIITPPTTIYADGTAISTYSIKGNTVQDGTPTPSNPVDVQGVGERTENLFDVNGTYSLKSNSITITNNSITATLGGSGTDRIYYTQTYTAGTYKISFDVQRCEGRLYSNKEFTGSTYNSYYDGYYRTITGVQTITFAEDFTIGFILAGAGGNNAVVSNIMFRLSTSTADYEPYGYKIPILNGQASAVNYLGSVASNRQIYKLVLDGTENYGKDSGGTYLYYKAVNPTHAKIEQCLCTHLPNASDYPRDSVGIYATKWANNAIYFNFGAAVMDVQPSGNTTTGLKEYLAAQYAAGTPVTIWYILETPTTGIVNEPLMKISTYADSISNATAIPTTEGANSITVDTTVQPSEFTATWTGWHDSSVKEYDGTDWQ